MVPLLYVNLANVARSGRTSKLNFVLGPPICKSRDDSPLGSEVYP
jgi:hypothetical protein